MAIRELKRDIAIDHAHPNNKLPLPKVRQGSLASLCWAACTASILLYYNKLNSDRLCHIVMKMKGLTSCCFPQVPATEWEVRAPCDQTIDEENVRPKWQEAYQLNSDFVSQVLTAEDLFREVEENQRPVMIRKDRPGFVDHVVIIYGWQYNNHPPLGRSNWLFSVFDPEGVSNETDYNSLLSTWRSTWYHLPKKGSGRALADVVGGGEHAMTFTGSDNSHEEWRINISDQIADFLPTIRDQLQSELHSAELGESLKIWELNVQQLMSGYAGDLDGLVSDSGCWHHQVFLNGEPLAYAESRPTADHLTVYSMAVSPLAEKIDQAIGRLSDSDEEVRFLVAPALRVYGFWMVSTHRVYLIDVPPAFHSLQYHLNDFLPAGDFLKLLRADAQAFQPPKGR